MIEILADSETLSRRAAALFADEATKAIARNGRFVVLLSGGETPRRTYQLLAEEPFRSRISWDHVYFFWGDERYVPVGDGRSNAVMVRRALLDRVPVMPDQIYPIDCFPSPDQAAVEYEDTIRNFFAPASPGFDLAILGLGEDGHTASLLPYSTAVDEEQRLTAVTRRTEEDFSRVTVTAPLINNSQKTIFLVAGANKSTVLKEVLEGRFDPHRLPAQLIRPKGRELLWLVDKSAGASVTLSGK